MSTSVSLEHRTTYRFDRPVDLGPHLIRLRPAPHCRTPISAYSLTLTPPGHLNWQQDPYGNSVARVVFPQRATALEVKVALVADLTTINPFDFFVEDYATGFPFRYADPLAADLAPYLVPPPSADGSSALKAWLDGLDTSPRTTVDFLVELNSAVREAVSYTTRMEPGVQEPDHTLTTRVGSCRDSAWLLVAALRHVGLAARFVSGYLVQLDEQEPAADVTDLHAWAEAYVPGAGWIGLDPTSALLAGEGHIPLAATPRPDQAAPITGSTGPAEVTFSYANLVNRFAEEVRLDQPYSEGQLQAQHRLGLAVDERLTTAGLELTMGGEPTFVSREEPTAPEWTVAADGGRKQALAGQLARRLAEAFAPGALVQHSQGRWYPGEALPRWQVGVVWRRDDQALWRHPHLLADPLVAGDEEDKAAARAEAYGQAVTAAFGLPPDQLHPCYESGDGADGNDPAAWALPLTPAWWGSGWASPRWRVEGSTDPRRLHLLPGELAAGQRLPLDALTGGDDAYPGEDSYLRPTEDLATGEPPQARVVELHATPSRTALVVQPRGGHVRVFLPPLERAERFTELVGLLDRVAGETGTPVVLEGYGPPPDPRLTELLVTPDPGVLEVNVHPAWSWTELTETTSTVYRLAGELGLGSETFGLDGRPGGTGGGNHWTLGGPEPARSPLLRRPDLLVSLLTYWQHHPALSYAFAGRFVGATCQAPRVDEGRPDTLYELEIAFAEIERMTSDPAGEHDAGLDSRPWLIDRALRPLLTDLTGNAHRSEFCVDKLYSPESLRGRLGLLELRGFEMPPHPDLALIQALLIRTVLARCAEEPYRAALVRWGSRLHEQYLLPHFVAADLADVLADLRRHGFDVDLTWFTPFLEFRFPLLGRNRIDAGPLGTVELELRTAIEPWPVLGDSSSGAASRYVDSSVERLQVVVSGFNRDRLLLVCNGAPVPLTPTDTPGRFVAGVRYKAWDPWSARHPSLPVDSPLAFDLIDRTSRLSRGGATYHVVQPGGRTYEHPPVNAKEAEVRRTRRFEAVGRAAGLIDVEALDAEQAWRSAQRDDYPLTLDLRRRTPRSWGRLP
jgi:uncharacterized protein (DUF2126 family)/transglutaminase-like putative cysteine protease